MDLGSFKRKITAQCIISLHLLCCICPKDRNAMGTIYVLSRLGTSHSSVSMYENCINLHSCYHYFCSKFWYNIAPASQSIAANDTYRRARYCSQTPLVAYLPWTEFPIPKVGSSLKWGFHHQPRERLKWVEQEKALETLLPFGYCSAILEINLEHIKLHNEAYRSIPGLALPRFPRPRYSIPPTYCISSADRVRIQ